MGCYCCVRYYSVWTVLVVLYGLLLLCEILLSVWIVLVVLYGLLLLLCEILLCVDSTGGTVWAVIVVV